ncbi:MAG: hypothetical protein ACXV4A_03815 [Actinomycetes bacterium]
MTSAVVLAIQDNAVSPGVLGFLVVAALGVATYLLVRSMNRQFRKIDLPDDKQAPGSEGAKRTPPPPNGGSGRADPPDQSPR